MPNSEVLTIFTLKNQLNMSKSHYLSRICDTELQNALATMGAVLIEGAKWCGKTSTADNVARSTLFMQDPDNAQSYQEMADTNLVSNLFQTRLKFISNLS